jgi:methionyl-tRNA synthetase
MEDLDLNLQDFTARVNSDLLGKYINIASRSAGFLVKRFGGLVDDSAMNHPLLNQLADASEEIADLYETREYAKALRKVMELADAVNGFVDTNKPWEIAKDPAREKELQTICSITLEAFRRLTLYLKPVVPNVAAGVEKFFGISPMSWADINNSLNSKQAVQTYQHLMTRIDPALIDKLIEANQQQ